MNIAALDVLEPDPLEIDPRPCELCGGTIDQHERVDTPEGPEFYCYPDDDIVTRWELADPRDAWRHTGEAPPPLAPAPPIRPRPYHAPQSTIDAFFYVLKTKDAADIADWLADHPRDEKYLQKIWEQKCSTAAAK
jgi:hypothetical protein